VDESSFSLYPNPTEDAFTVKSNAQIQLVQVLDVSGRVVRTQAFGSAKQGTIDVSDLQSGTYFAVIETSEGTQVVKPVVIQ
ncbi:MAG: T9SS C-terminal target domain-containing protein, partial [Euryarchaeota archaeon]|nr:T9SS C-terminal target domain-containing protein [Euryarchaeota archaeon]